MKKLCTLTLLLAFVAVQAQDFYISPSAEVNVDEGGILYSDFLLNNEGTLSFDNVATLYPNAGLYIDSGLTNSIGSLDLNNAYFHLGSNQSRAAGTHQLRFNASFDDEAKYVVLGKQGGQYDVVGPGALRILNTLNTESGVLNANDSIILVSYDTAAPNPYPFTSIVAESTPDVGTQVNGIRVERFIPADRAFRMMASPVNSQGTNSVALKDDIFENWQNGGDVTTAGVGTHITGTNLLVNPATITNGDINASGFDVNQTGNPSLFLYENDTQVWNPLQTVDGEGTIGQALNTQTAYFMLIRGDRASIDLSVNDFPTEVPTVLNQTGSLQIGTFSPSLPPLGGDSFVALANPYEAPVDLRELIGTLSGLSPTVFRNQVWVWEQEGNLTDGSPGAFVNLPDLDAAPPSVVGSSMTNILQPGQSVFIQTSSTYSGTPSIVFEETKKADQTALTAVFDEDSYMSSFEGFVRLGLYNDTVTPFVNMAYDGFIIQFDNQFSNNVDDLDAYKLFGYDENMYLEVDNTLLSVNKRKMPSELNEVIDFSLTGLDETDYRFSVDLAGFGNLPNGIMLWDKYEDTYTVLADQMVIPFSVDSSIPASIESNRFALVFETQTLSTTENNDLADISIFPNPVFSDDLTIQFSNSSIGNDTSVSVYSILGQKVYDKSFNNVDQTLTLEGLSSFATGTYILNVRQDGLTKSFKIIKE